MANNINRALPTRYCLRQLTCAGCVLLATAGSAFAGISSEVLQRLGLSGNRSGQAGQVERIQSDLSWIGVFRGRITGQLDFATRESIRTFQVGLGHRANGQLSSSQAAILRVRADAMRDAAEFSTEIVEWTGTRLTLPRGFYGRPFVTGDNSQHVGFHGRDAAASSIVLHRHFIADLNTAEWLGVMRRSVEELNGRILLSGRIGRIAFMVAVEEESSEEDAGQPDSQFRTYSVFEVGGSEIRGMNIRLLESHAAHMRPVVGEILASFEPMYGKGVSRSEIESRLRSGDFPGSDIQPPWSRAMIGNGSGSIVSADGHILTNHHVVSGCAYLTVNGNNAALVGSDVRVDLALLLAPQLAGRNPVRFSDRPAELGEPVIVMGYPVFGISPSLNVTAGIVSSTVGFRGDRTRIQITAPVQPGNSGGPVLSQDGTQVAVVAEKPSVVTALMRNIENIGWAIRGAQAKEFLSRFGVVPLQTVRSYNPPREESARAMREWRRFTVRVECLGE